MDYLLYGNQQLRAGNGEIDSPLLLFLGPLVRSYLRIIGEIANVRAVQQHFLSINRVSSDLKATSVHNRPMSLLISTVLRHRRFRVLCAGRQS